MYKANILIVDDDNELRDYLTSYFKKNGYYSEAEESLIKAYELKLHHPKYHFMVIDLKFENEDAENIFGGVKLFSLCYQYMKGVKGIILSNYSFEEQKENIFKQLISLVKDGQKAQEMLSSMEKVYVQKIGTGRYSNRLLAMIKVWNKELLAKCKKEVWQKKIRENKIDLILNEIKILIKQNKDFDLLSNRYNKYKADVISGRVSEEKLNTEFNIISYHLWDIVQAIQEEDFYFDKLIDYALKNDIKL